MSEALEKAPENNKPSSPAQKSAARMAAVQALYTIDYTGNASGSTVQDFLQRKMPVDVDAPVPEDFDAELFRSIVDGTLARQKDIDDMVSGGLDPKWPMDRLEKIIKSILRAGVGELLTHAQTDTAIIINDYVNVAHGFFAGKEPALVNAVLDKVSKSLRS
ncbi:MAG: transcription antitermination factor NusB [Alphaproteobacteria bacterium]|nr:transcription antitermination factor NusB [Alphaproteobacteria bacterium]